MGEKIKNILRADLQSKWASSTRSTMKQKDFKMASRKNYDQVKACYWLISSHPFIIITYLEQVLLFNTYSDNYYVLYNVFTKFK